MRAPNFFGDRLPGRVPGWLRPARRLFLLLERGVGAAAGSRWNPLHHSGAIAGSLLLILIVTGIGLLLFYRLSSPYVSVAEISAGRSAGSLLRSIHRYATDLTALAVFLHVVKMLLQGKTWGPRALAWVTGAILLALFLVSSYTGFILIWDRFGLRVARAAAEIVDLLPFLPTPASRNFSGDVPLGTSFFFMNLFLHVAIPLGMFAALAVHVSRVKKPMWTLRGAAFAGLLAALALLALRFPLSIDSPADPLSLDRSFRSDALFAAWIPFQDFLGPGWTFGILGAAAAAFVAIPWLWRPRPEAVPPRSFVDEAHCEGCGQCVEDCPFDAIEMRPRALGQGSELVAHVLSDLCVSCGVCSGSCNQFSVGPEPWRGRRQLQAAGALLADPARLALVLCANRRAPELPPECSALRVECVGILHASTFTRMLQHYRKIAVWGCADGECGARVGGRILRERLDGTRSPTLPARVDRHAILWLEPGNTADDVRAAVRRALAGTAAPARRSPLRLTAGFLAVAAPLILIPPLAFFSVRFPAPSDSGLRLAWRTPATRRVLCRERTPTELQALPQHMRTAQVCAERTADDLLEVEIDGQSVHRARYAPKGFRSDRPVIVNLTLPVPPGTHRVRIRWGAEDAHEIAEFEGTFAAGQARLIFRDPNQSRFLFR